MTFGEPAGSDCPLGTAHSSSKALPGFPTDRTASPASTASGGSTATAARTGSKRAHLGVCCQNGSIGGKPAPVRLKGVNNAGGGSSSSTTHESPEDSGYGSSSAVRSLLPSFYTRPFKAPRLVSEVIMDGPASAALTQRALVRRNPQPHTWDGMLPLLSTICFR
jgi:hypothetical protein